MIKYLILTVLATLISYGIIAFINSKVDKENVKWYTKYMLDKNKREHQND